MTRTFTGLAFVVSLGLAATLGLGLGCAEEPAAPPSPPPVPDAEVPGLYEALTDGDTAAEEQALGLIEAARLQFYAAEIEERRSIAESRDRLQAPCQGIGHARVEIEIVLRHIGRTHPFEPPWSARHGLHHPLAILRQRLGL